MKKPNDLFLALLHERYAKPSGFKKNGSTFSRAHEGYSEHFNIQGSAWNSADGPWRFYINCAVGFPDVPLRAPGAGLWKYHAHTRIENLCAESPSQFDVTDENREQLVEQVGRLIGTCSEYFMRRHQTLRESYVTQKFRAGFLFDPEIHG